MVPAVGVETTDVFLGNRIKSSASSFQQGFFGPGRCFPQDALYFREGFFYWVEVRLVRYQEHEGSSCLFDQALDTLALVHREVIHHHYLSTPKLWSKEVLYVGFECLMPSTAPSTLMEGFTPTSEPMALTSEMFSPQRDVLSPVSRGFPVCALSFGRSFA